MGNKYETRAHNIKTANDANSQWMDEDFGYGFGKSFHYLVSIPKLKKKKKLNKAPFIYCVWMLHPRLSCIKIRAQHLNRNWLVIIKL